MKRAQQLGFSLTEIDVLLGLAAGGPRSCDAARALATEKLQSAVVCERGARMPERWNTPRLGGMMDRDSSEAHQIGEVAEMVGLAPYDP